MPSFSEIASIMVQSGMKIPGDRISIRIPEPRENLGKALEYFLSLQGRKMEFLPEYEKVIEWLNDNQGRGLFMFGNCGRGKSLLARYVLPAIILKHCRKIVAVYDMFEVNAQLDEVLKKKIISIDDVGTESESVRFGERRMAFPEIIDSAEKDGKLMIITTNLSQDEIKDRYGSRVLDRIVSTTKRVAFNGKSLRS